VFLGGHGSPDQAPPQSSEDALSKFFAILAAGLIAGCTNLPADGPTHRDITGAATASVANERRQVVYDYVLVDVSDKVIDNLVDIEPGTFFHSFGTGRGGAPTLTVGVGDVLQVTIFESSAGGLFIPPEAGVRPGNFVTLPSQTVGKNGTISVPYAGDVRAAGRTPQEIKTAIEKALSSRAVEPQVVVTLAEQTAMSVSVVGTGGSSRLQLRANDRILDVIARAGSGSIPGYEMFVTLQRGVHRATVYFPALIRDPRENIYMRPGDTLYIYREQKKFIAIGALGAGGQTSGVTGLFPFEQEQLTLSEALAKAGGLVDGRASPQVFLYRMEPREVVERMGVETGKFPPTTKYIPTVYRANFRDPSVFFVTQRFPMRNKDAIFVATADSVQLEKFIAHSSAITSYVAGTSVDVLATRDALRALRR
jgi:polysaccharide export outer membrane protein